MRVFTFLQLNSPFPTSTCPQCLTTNLGPGYIKLAAAGAWSALAPQ